MGASYTNDMQPAISGIVFIEGGVEITWMSPDDVRDRGRIVQAHQITITGKTYRDGLETLREAAEDLLKDVLEDWPGMEPARSPREDDDAPDDD